jgi:NAD(P)H-flavin reductase
MPMAAEPPVQLIRIRLNGPFSFRAGQYLEILHDCGGRIPLSIASPPAALPELQLHYRSTPQLKEAQLLDQLLAATEPLNVTHASGDVQLDPSRHCPLILIAGGTGVAQALCMALDQTARQPEIPVLLLACADDAADFYFRDLLPRSKGFEAVLIDDSSRNESNRGLAWIRSNQQRFTSDSRIVLAGSPGFVYAMTDTLLSVGITQERLESDVYVYAPR